MKACLVCVVVAGIAACSDAFKQEAEPHVFVQPVDSLPIPDTMTRTQVIRAGVALRSASGDDIAGARVTWTSSDERVVHVDTTGDSEHAMLTATGLGQAQITVSIDDGIGTVPQTVMRDTVRVLERWLSVAVGGAYACATNVDSVAYCWGVGPLGNGQFGYFPEPVRVRGLLDFSSDRLVVGDETACARVGEQAVYCWGENSAGEMGNADADPSPTATRSMQAGLRSREFHALSLRGASACGTFIVDEQDPEPLVTCWGINAFGQLGAPLPGTTCEYNFRAYPCARRGNLPLDHPFDGRLSADSVSVGGSHACAIGIPYSGGGTQPGGVYCWGAAATGQAGPGDRRVRITRCTSTPDDLVDPAGVPCLTGPAAVDRNLQFVTVRVGWDVFIGGTPTDIFSPTWQGEGHTCAIDNAGVAYCWGKNDFGQLGSPSDSTCQRWFRGDFVPDQPTPCRSHPSPVPAPAPFQAVTLGSAHTCGLQNDGAVLCWGDNREGQLGDDSGVDHRMGPGPIASTRTFASIDAGPDDTCGVTIPDGSIFCWGRSYGSRPSRIPDPR